MFKKKIKNILVITQLAILLVFGLFALGSASSRDVGGTNAVRAVLQGAACGGTGYTFIGYYNSPSDCSTACANAGYAHWCTGENTTSCFCQ